MMKQNILNLKYACVALLTILFSACSNETDLDEQSSTKQYTINVSIRSGEQRATRASDLIEQEKIKRYDIFIYDKTGENIVKYLTDTNTSGLEEFSAKFESTSEFTTDKDVFVVVNNLAWEGKTNAEMEAITKTQLKAMELSCIQNIEGTSGDMTAFNGYKKSSSENEPFVMSAISEGYNFSAPGKSKLQLELKRSYAKVILMFTTTLGGADDDKDWIDLKTIRVRAINHVPTVARLFCADGSGYTPTLESYIYKEGSEYTLSSINADLTKSSYGFNSFSSNILALRLFPQDPSGDINNHSTSLLLDFEVGAVGSPKITNNFKRLIKIGDEKNGYRIDPNFAYIITLTYGKTTNSITTDYRVVPWNLFNWEQDVEWN